MNVVFNEEAASEWNDEKEDSVFYIRLFSFLSF